MDWEIEVIHHSRFIRDLMDAEKLTIDPKTRETLTYHDPCYLGRHNREFDAPRSLLKKTGARIKEMADCRAHSFCCGAGGGLMWTEETLGTRINHTRTDQALDTGAGIIATACPFCMTMLDDGIKDKGKEEEKKVRDIAQIIAQNL
jgi:Fe-S oxidoreductase